MVRIGHLDDSFLGILELEASQVEGQSLQLKDEKRRKRAGAKKLRAWRCRSVSHLNFGF